MAKRKKDEEKEERGFASMDPERQREIASAGGRAAHEKGTAHEFTSEEAREAGRKGGEATAREHGFEFYQAIGRKGGQTTAEEHGLEFYQTIGRKGGQKTAQEHGPEFYQTIGRKGGQASPGKFQEGSARAREAGRKGGQARTEEPSSEHKGSNEDGQNNKNETYEE